jgi:hypothetical protein
MTRYLIKFHCSDSGTFEVEAKDEEEAEAIAEEMSRDEIETIADWRPGSFDIEVVGEAD